MSEHPKLAEARATLLGSAAATSHLDRTNDALAGAGKLFLYCEDVEVRLTALEAARDERERLTAAHDTYVPAPGATMPSYEQRLAVAYQDEARSLRIDRDRFRDEAAKWLDNAHSLARKLEAAEATITRLTDERDRARAASVELAKDVALAERTVAQLTAPWVNADQDAWESRDDFEGGYAAIIARRLKAPQGPEPLPPDVEPVAAPVVEPPTTLAMRVAVDYLGNDDPPECELLARRIDKVFAGTEAECVSLRERLAVAERDALKWNGAWESVRSETKAACDVELASVRSQLAVAERERDEEKQVSAALHEQLAAIDPRFDASGAAPEPQDLTPGWWAVSVLGSTDPSSPVALFEYGDQAQRWADDKYPHNNRVWQVASRPRVSSGGTPTASPVEGGATTKPGESE